MFILISILLFGFSSPQWNPSGNEKISLGDYTLEISISSSYHIETIAEEEGPIIIFHFPAKMNLIFVGSPLIELEYDSITPERRITINNVSFYKGRVDDYVCEKYSIFQTRIYLVYKEDIRPELFISSIQVYNEKDETPLLVRMSNEYRDQQIITSIAKTD